MNIHTKRTNVNLKRSKRYLYFYYILLKRLTCCNRKSMITWRDTVVEAMSSSTLAWDLGQLGWSSWWLVVDKRASGIWAGVRCDLSPYICTVSLCLLMDLHLVSLQDNRISNHWSHSDSDWSSSHLFANNLVSYLFLEGCQGTWNKRLHGPLCEKHEY